MNLCSLLWIESFIWVPMDNQADGLLLVCYHRRGVITVWNINQRLIAHDRFMVDVPVFGHTGNVFILLYFCIFFLNLSLWRQHAMVHIRGQFDSFTEPE